MSAQILEHDFEVLIVYIGEAKFHIYGGVSRHNCAIGDSEPAKELSEHNRSSPKVQVWFARTQGGAIDPFFYLLGHHSRK
jgi:hypothetical protein